VGSGERERSGGWRRVWWWLYNDGEEVSMAMSRARERRRRRRRRRRRWFRETNFTK